jgi:hypothetical protein
MAKAPVSTKDFDPGQPRSNQMLPGRENEILVNVHGDDLTVFAHDLSHERRVKAGASTNLEDTLTPLECELLQHDGHDRWL